MKPEKAPKFHNTVNFGVYPPHCVTVADFESLVGMFPTVDFWPNGFDDADPAWMALFFIE